MHIRRAESSDFNQIIIIADRIYQALEHKAQFNWPKEVISQELQQVITLVNQTEDGVLAFLCYRNLPDTFEISVLGTDPLAQKRQLQFQLIRYLQELAANSQKSIILEVHQENAKALALYLKGGFVLLNRRKAYYSDGGDALVLEWKSNKAGCEF